MNSENARALAGLSDLTRQAREIDWQGVDAGQAAFLSGLGQLDVLASQGALPTQAADQQQRSLIENRKALLSEIIATGPSWHYRQIPAARDFSKQELARTAVDLAAREGVRLTAFADCALEALPGQHGLSVHLRHLLTEHRAEIVAELRAGLIRIEPPAAPKHRAHAA